ncbi:MAG: glycosyltransferase family 2 protein [Verrucomicrobiota bacterium]
MELSIIIVNWNSAEYVRGCLRSLAKFPPSKPHEILVVDSGSFDTCGEMMAREFPSAIFVQSKDNLGFAGANNLGASRSRGKNLLFINPDTEVLAGAVDRLLLTLSQNPDAGIVGARLLNTDGSLQTSCVQAYPTILNQVLDADILYRAFPKSSLWGIAALSNESNTAQPVEVISGACILIRRSVFEIVKGFDQRFFMYSEDLDLCYRVKQAGFDCLYEPGAKITHHGGGSSSSARSMFSVVMTRESVCRYFKFNHGAGKAAAYRFTMGLAAMLRLPLVACLWVLKKISGAKNYGAVRKWFAILRWSIGLESWAAKKTGHGGEPSAATANQPVNTSCAA